MNVMGRKGGNGRSEEDHGFAANELKSDGVPVKLIYMLRDVFLSRTSRPYGQPEKERSRKKKELVSDGKGGYDGMARRREKKEETKSEHT